MLKVKSILHPNDLTEHSENALRLAASVARDADAKLIVLYVKQPQETMMGEFGMTPPEPEASDEGYLERLQALIPEDAGVDAEFMVVEGTPIDEILRVTKENACDLIVLGNHAHSWLGRLFTADVVDKVIHKAACPVVSVRGPS